MYATPPESCVLEAVTGVGCKSIAPILSSQSVFEVGTHFPRLQIQKYGIHCHFAVFKGIWNCVILLLSGQAKSSRASSRMFRWPSLRYNWPPLGSLCTHHFYLNSAVSTFDLRPWFSDKTHMLLNQQHGYIYQYITTTTLEIEWVCQNIIGQLHLSSFYATLLLPTKPEKV